MPINKGSLIALLFISPISICAPAQSGKPDADRVRILQVQIVKFRKELKIPGMSVIVLRDSQVIWKSGFGYADVGTRRPYTPDTPQPIASLTKTFAATLVMQLVEQSRLNLNEPVADYVPDVEDRRAQMKHLLSHTSEGTPGEQYRYSGDRYDLLTEVLEKKTGKPFRQLIAETFIVPLGMKETAPGQDLLKGGDHFAPILGQQEVEHYKHVLSGIALPYALYGEETIRTAFPPQGIGAAAGLIPSVDDLAKFDVAVDQNRFLKPETQALAWTPFVSNSGKTLPHGLGWFAETFAGRKLVWHYGHWPGMYSATYVKVPAENLTMILLANSEAASAPFYHTGGIETSVFACAFPKVFAWDGHNHGCSKMSDDAMRRRIADRRAEVRRPISLPEEALRQYEGEYKLLESGSLVSVSYRDRSLFINVPRKFPSELFPESATRFFLKTVDYEVTFVPDQQGKPTRLYIHTPGELHEAQRQQ